jgi:hypothetical protein
MSKQNNGTDLIINEEDDDDEFNKNTPEELNINEIDKINNNDNTNAPASIENDIEQNPNINQTESPAKGLNAEILEKQSGENNEISSAAPPTGSADTPTAPSANPTSTSTATADNAVYAIIKIDSEKKITVLDAMPDGEALNTAVSPYDLLANKTESVFAVKIVKKDNCDGATDQIKCISFDNSHYELDLTTAVAAVGKLLEQDFLSNIADSKGDVSESVDSKGDGSKDAYSKDYKPNFKAGDTINYNNKNIHIRSIGKSTTDGKSLYDTESGSLIPEDVDKTAKLVILSHGGSRKNRGQQSKKTKRKYYVYRK